MVETYISLKKDRNLYIAAKDCEKEIKILYKKTCFLFFSQWQFLKYV